MNQHPNNPTKPNHSMNARRVNAAAGIILAAQKQGKQIAAALAIALESACLLQSPESAAEAAAMRFELQGVRLVLFETEQENRHLRDRVAELEAIACTAGTRAEQRHLMDPLDHVLEHLADENGDL